MPITIHSGPGDTMPGRDDEPDLVQLVIARLGSHFRGRRDHEALDAAATDVLDERAHAAGDFHTPTPRQIDELVAAVQARGEAGTA